MLIPFLLLLAAADSSQVNNLLRGGLVDLQQGKVAEARTQLETAARLDPSNAFVWTALVRTYQRLKQPALAKEAAGKADGARAGNPVLAHALAAYYSEAGDTLHAAALEAEYAKSPNADGGALERAAGLYLNAGNPQAALPLLAAAWDRAKTDPQVAFEYSHVLLEKQDFTKAAEVLESAAAAHPANVQLSLALGVARYGQRRFNEAIAAFLKTIQLDPKVPQPYLFLGKMLDQAGPELPKVVSAYREWTRLEPKRAEPLLLLAKALTAANGSSDEAETLLRKSIALDQKNWEAHYELGQLLSKKHQYTEAATELETSVQLKPDEPMPHYHLARVYDRLGKSDEAAKQRAEHQRLSASAARTAQ